MIDDVTVQKGCYHDSARLMAIARELTSLEGIGEAVVLMGTDANRGLLRDAGFAAEELQRATPLDLVVALRAEDRASAAAAQERLRSILSGASERGGAAAVEVRPGSVHEAVAEHPGANLVSVAVPGPYAAYVAHRALDEGRNVFLFSDNVPVAAEVGLKRRAREAGLLVMGPDCGTAILAGVGLGFANRVERGPIGIVGASGTGIQEIYCLLDRLGVGVSHAIGTGSRDLSAQVGGLMTEASLELLAEDAATRGIVLVAKHPDPAVSARVHRSLATIVAGGRPVVVRYLGETARPSADGVVYASSLDEAAEVAAGWAGVTRHLPSEPSPTASGAVPGVLVGLFGGGSLAAEARLILAGAGIETTVPSAELGPGALPAGNLIVDTGDDFYTVGRPHPMVDQTVRCALLRWVGASPTVGALLLDLVLGDGAHPDPAPEIVGAVAEARRARGGVPLEVIASVSGTRHDPQSVEAQERVLREGGVRVAATAARAATAAAAALKGVPQEVKR